MHSRHAVTKLAALLLLLGFSFNVQAADAGAFEELSGTVMITGADKVSRKAVGKDKVQSGDKITTESKSEAVIKMADDSVVILRPSTQYQFNEFKYEQKQTDSIFASLLRGTVRLVSGVIGRKNPSGVKFTTQTATVGIRGTDFELSVIPEDTSEARAGVYNYVHDGATNIKIASGQSLDVKKEQTAFAPDKPRPGEEPLQLLAEPPLFLQQGGGFDTLIQSITSQPMNVIHQMPAFR
jgi:hypothetical protein